MMKQATPSRGKKKPRYSKNCEHETVIRRIWKGKSAGKTLNYFMAKAVSFLSSVHPYPMSERFPLPGSCHLEIVVAVCGSQTLEDLAENLVMGGNYRTSKTPPIKT